MAVTTTNLAMGPATVYTGAFGATEPADTAIALNAAPPTPDWTDVGGTLGGVTITITQQWKEFEVDQIVEVPERRVTRREITAKTQLAEVTLDNLILSMNSGTKVAGTAGAPDTYEPSNVDSGASPTYKAVILDGAGAGGRRRRVIIRKCLSTENVDVVASKDGQAAYPVTFTGHYVSADGADGGPGPSGAPGKGTLSDEQLIALLWPARGPLTQRLDEIGWVVEAVDDVWADVLHYYHRDIWQLDGPAALKLAYRLIDVMDVMDVIAMADPPRYRSSVMAAFDTGRPAPAPSPAGDATVEVDELDPAMIARLQLGDAIDLVVVTDDE